MLLVLLVLLVCDLKAIVHGSVLILHIVEIFDTLRSLPVQSSFDVFIAFSVLQYLVTVLVVRR